MNKTICHFLLLLLTLTVGCKEAYDPPIQSANNAYLVVEGTLNTNGPTQILLTRTYKLDDTARLRGETGAVLTVEGDNGYVNNLSESGGGYYTSPGLALVTGASYRLRIRTSDGKEYLSDDLVARVTPPISAVTWKRDRNDVQLYVSTADPSNNTRYYRWEFEETWEIHSNYGATVIYESATNTVRSRVFPEEDVFTCWKNDISHNILVGTSVRLQSDIINEAPIQFINFSDEKLAQRYSILVRQFAITPAAYEFYQLMRRNTEEIGSVFGPLPSELRGNIRCVSDPKEYVLGYLTAASAEEKRIFISRQDVPDWRFNFSCNDSLVANNPEALRLNYANGSLEPYVAKYGVGTFIEGYFSSTPPCVDCTIRGGSTQRPSFW